MNFTQAAAELGITQSAVSHQMKELSVRCGFVLFRRNGNVLELTEKGDEFSILVRDLLNSLDTGLASLMSDGPFNSCKIHCDAVFANKWLLPRLDRIEAQQMKIRFELQYTGEQRDADIVVGFQSIDGFENLIFEDDACVAVCSPDMLHIGNDCLSEGQLRLEPQITLAAPSVAETYGLQADTSTGLMGEQENHASVELALQAAVHGRGVVVVRHSVADDDLRAGRLVFATSQKWPSHFPIVFSINPSGRHADDCRMLASWMLDELRLM